MRLSPRKSTRAGLDIPPSEDHGLAGVWEAIYSLNEVVREHVSSGVPPKGKEVMHEDRTIEKFQHIEPLKFHSTSNPMEVEA